MKKGITLIALSTIIIIMIIITTTVTITGANAINNSKKMKFASELVFMQETIEDYKLLNSGKLPVIEETLTNENLPEGEYYEIDMSLLGLVDTTYGRKLNSDEEDIYVLSTSDGIVYYLKGLKVGNTTYYYLNDELKQIINYTESAEIVKDGIIFTQSNTGYTNEEITLSVQVPTKYSDISVISQDVSITDFSEESDYYIYEITKASNFDVVVTYTKDESSMKQVYTVSNYDNEAPSIEISDIINISEENEVNITVLTDDNLSGINKILYEVDNVEKDYFEVEKKGKLVTNNNVSVSNHTQYVTFYVVDNAGNSKLILTSLDASATEEDYAHYGLILHYDGINNTGYGHSSTTSTWVDLSGKGNNATIADNIFSTNVEGNGWDDDSINIMSSTPNNYSSYIMQNTTFSGIESFTVELKGNFEPNSGTTEVYTRILSTNGGYTADYQEINGVDLTYPGETQKIVSYASNGVAENAIAIALPYTSTAITIVWDYNTKILSYYVEGSLYLTKEITFDNVNCEKICLDHCRLADYSGDYSYNSIRVYNRALTEDEIKQNYNIDKIRFGI